MPGPVIPRRLGSRELWNAVATGRTTNERLPHGSDWVAILRGPIVLASPAGTNDLRGLYADDSRMGHVASGPLVPMDRVPVLLTSASELPRHIKEDTNAGRMRFRLADVVEPPVPEGPAASDRRHFLQLGPQLVIRGPHGGMQLLGKRGGKL